MNWSKVVQILIAEAGELQRQSQDSLARGLKERSTAEDTASLVLRNLARALAEGLEP